MRVSSELNLKPRQVAKSLQELHAWRLPDTADVLALHRGVLTMLQVMGELSALEMPVALEADGSQGEEGTWLADSEMLHGLLENCVRALDGYPHRLRIQRVAKQSPGHALQLEEARCAALDRLRSLRARLDFVRAGLESLEEPAWIRQRAQASRVLQ